MHQNPAIILQQLCYSKISFKVLVTEVKGHTYGHDSVLKAHEDPLVVLVYVVK